MIRHSRTYITALCGNNELVNAGKKGAINDYCATAKC